MLLLFVFFYMSLGALNSTRLSLIMPAWKKEGFGHKKGESVLGDVTLRVHI